MAGVNGVCCRVLGDARLGMCGTPSDHGVAPDLEPESFISETAPRLARPGTIDCPVASGVQQHHTHMVQLEPFLHKLSHLPEHLLHVENGGE